MNNEPVAWINRKGKDGEHGYLEWDKDDEAEINTPLYTHPVKELTQQEIDKIENRVYLKTIAKGKSLGSYSKELIKAILLKAQEK